MSNEDLQKKYDHLVEKVRRMREVQNHYFKYRTTQDLKLSKRLEHDVDTLISKVEAAKKANQTEMF